MEPPKLWWSQSAAEARGHASAGVLEAGADGRPETPLPPFEGEPLDSMLGHPYPAVGSDESTLPAELDDQERDA